VRSSALFVSVKPASLCNDARARTHKQANKQTNKHTHTLDSSVVIEGIRFYGSPWTPYFYGWGFNAYRGGEIAAIWRRIPTDTDVLITHGPPIGIGDACFDGQRAGCVDLLREIETRVRTCMRTRVALCSHS
jgi:hypothetical protein